ncbi:MAG: class I SAM-dependent methyltransferase [Sphingobacteriales bacterium]|nr:class I SAM-dependent methyltransferase [Sphingobacteriales bacterium]
MQTTTEILIKNKRIVPKEFNKIAGKYDFATALSQGYQDDLNRSANLLQLKGDELVLDICCGTGKSTAALLPKMTTGKIIAIDNSEDMLSVARQKFSKPIAQRKIDLQLQDAMQLDFADESVDAIFMAYGLRNMPDYEKCVDNLFRMLKPGGQLVIHDYSLRDTWYAKLFWAILGYGFIVPFCTLVSGSSTIYTYLIKSVLKFLSPAEIIDLLIRKGFTETGILQQPGWRKPILHGFRAVKP